MSFYIIDLAVGSMTGTIPLREIEEKGVGKFDT